MRLDQETELPIVRRAFAKQITAAAGVTAPAIENAFAAVRREDFLGKGPWPIFRYLSVYVPTPSDDPVYLYTNDLVGIDPERKINNGQPSLHAYLLDKAMPREGEHIVHVGTGSGYYTAIMAEMVGPSGRVTGIEFDSGLAQAAKSNLARYKNVEIREGDGAVVSFDPAHVIYVNAGATAPARAWLDRLVEGGRLILPLTTNAGFGTIEPEKMASRGAIFRIRRDGEAYQAAWISPVAIFPCAGNRDEGCEKKLAAALERGGARQVRRLYRDSDIPDERCWLSGDGWCLAFS